MVAAETSEAQLVVVLDAQPIEQALFQFDRSPLRDLLDEAVSRNVEIAMTDVQLQELRAHIDEQVRQVKQLAKSLEGDAGAGKRSLRKPSDDTKDGGVPLPRLLKHRLLGELLGGLGSAAELVSTAFEDVVKTKIRIIGTGHVAASRIIPKYFEGQAPFGPGRKKDEFPDAFSIEAVKDFAANNVSTEVVVVSGDPDWQAALKGSDAVGIFPNVAAALQHVRKLDDIAKALNLLLVGKPTALNESIEERFPELDFSLADEWSADVEDVSVNESNVTRIDVIEFKTRRATVEFDVDVKFNAAASYPDGDYSEWHQSYETAHIETHQVVVGTAELLLSSDLSEIETVSEVELGGGIEVSLGNAYEFTRKSPYGE